MLNAHGHQVVKPNAIQRPLRRDCDPVHSSSSPIATEESEHARQLSPGMAPPSRPLDRLLAPSDMTGNDPNTLRGYLKTWAEFGKGAGRGIADLVASPPPGTKENPVIWNPVTQLKKDWQGLKNLHEEYKTNPNYVAGELARPCTIDPCGISAFNSCWNGIETYKGYRRERCFDDRGNGRRFALCCQSFW